MIPYYDHKGITIYHGDCQEVLKKLNLQGINLVLTDPPYGIDGGRGGGNRQRKKGAYTNKTWYDTPDYIQAVCVPVVRQMVAFVGRVIVTPGIRCMRLYPEPNDIGCFWTPASVGYGEWGMISYSPIFYYGKDPRSGKGQSPSGRTVTEASNIKGHPCPKPLNAWKWLLNKGSMPGELVLDPFMGSGTTLVAAKHLGREAIGIEIEEKYCELAASRLEQEVLPMSFDDTIQTSFL